MIDSVVETFFNFFYVIINSFLNIIFAPLNQMMQPIMAGILSSEQVINFYNVMNSYVLPSVGFFVNLVPPLTWNSILIFILFYISLFSAVAFLHVGLKVLKVVKRLIPFA